VVVAVEQQLQEQLEHLVQPLEVETEVQVHQIVFQGLQQLTLVVVAEQVVATLIMDQEVQVVVALEMETQDVLTLVVAVVVVMDQEHLLPLYLVELVVQE
tara:strand:+ start:501 stop:800 length:300 start_codon:yes stop_codon:yes gene_type:complete